MKRHFHPDPTSFNVIKPWQIAAYVAVFILLAVAATYIAFQPDAEQVPNHQSVILGR